MDSVTEDALAIEVSDFGPIAEAEVELRPLTVFVGPSNTGKSFLAVLIYALHRYFSGRYLSAGVGAIDRDFRLRLGRRLGPRHRASPLSEASVNALSDMAEQIACFMDSRSGTHLDLSLPAPVVDSIRSGLEAQGDVLGEEISHCFGVSEIRRLIRRTGAGSPGRTTAGIVLRSRSASASSPAEQGLGITDGAISLKSEVPGVLRIPAGERRRWVEDPTHDWWSVNDDRRIQEYGEDRGTEIRTRLATSMLKLLTDFVQTTAAGPLDRPAWYLPADRTGVMHAHNVVVSSLIQSEAMAGLHRARSLPMLSGVLTDFLEQLVGMNQESYRRLGSGSAGEHADRIERGILGGSVGIERSEIMHYPSFTYQPDGWHDGLPLMNASSMVSELAPVVLYLRHVIEPGNVLIIEEPEAHLHPAMQVKLIRQLSALVDTDVRVVVTTHSEWVIEELTNITHKSALSPERRAGLSGGSIALSVEQVGVWWFEPKQGPGGSGSVVSNISLDSNFYPDDYAEVAYRLHNDGVEIAERVGGAE